MTIFHQATATYSNTVNSGLVPQGHQKMRLSCQDSSRNSHFTVHMVFTNAEEGESHDSFCSHLAGSNLVPESSRSIEVHRT